MFKRTALIIMLLSFSVTTAFSANSLLNKGTKKAILLISFGTSVPSARKSFENVEEETKKRFPGVEVRWGFTSNIIRKKLKKQGIITQTPQLALANLAEDGYTHIAIQSLHTIPGVEYDKIVASVSKIMAEPKLFENVTVGAPLLANHHKVDLAMAELLRLAPKERKPNEALIFMGHGSEHHWADLVYAAASAKINKLDKNAFLGTVEGHPTIDDVVESCKENGIKKAYLIPFMSVAGDHAKNDLAGPDDDSWKSVLEKNGVECIPVLKGTAEYDSMVKLWLDNLEKAFNEL